MNEPTDDEVQKELEALFDKLDWRDMLRRAYESAWWEQEIRDSFIPLRFEDRRIVIYTPKQQ